MMDVGSTSDAMHEYHLYISEASDINSVNQQLLLSVYMVYSDGFINAAMSTLDAKMVLKKGLCWSHALEPRIGFLLSQMGLRWIMLSFVRRIFLQRAILRLVKIP